jgi:Xaa-Pro aminopeptidase
MGALAGSYCSDLTRTFTLGRPDARFCEIYDIVHAAQQNAIERVEPGMKGSDAHDLAQSVIAAAGYGDRFGHGLGHGVGLQIHESPRVSRASDDVLEDGMVITVEPGIYLPGWGGIRIEDMGYMKDGKYVNFTTAPKLQFTA